MGLYIGRGDQDYDIKLVSNSRGSKGRVQLAADSSGLFSSLEAIDAPVFGQTEFDQYLSVNPMGETVIAYYSASQGELVEVGTVAALPREWLDADIGLAVGIISYSAESAVWVERTSFDGSSTTARHEAGAVEFEG